MRTHVGQLTLGLALAAIPTAGSSRAHAQADDAVHSNGADPAAGLAFRLEAGGGAMASSHQVDRLHYDSAHAEGTLRIAYSLIDELAVQVSGGYWHFISPTGDGYVVPLEAGLRLEPSLGEIGRVFIDGNLGVVFTGDLVRFGFDFGVGLEFDVDPAVAIGPMARLAVVVQPDEQNVYTDDAVYWVAGLSTTFRPWASSSRARASALADEDGDGIIENDLCPTQPEDVDGRRDDDGCPDPDDDGDGILDVDDSCPVVAENVNLYEDVDGCPDDPDADHDGVPLPTDNCPTEPEDVDGFADEDGCPDRDDDGDRILDVDDACRREAETMNGYLDTDGCPDAMPDQDHDGLADPTDRCPTQPENYNGVDDEDGCPDRGGIVVERTATGIHIPFQVRFAVNSDSIVGARSFQLLDSVASLLRQSTDITRLEVQGHTDDQGELDYNDDLSRRRAESVIRALVERGIDAGRLVPHGYGERCPAAEGTTRRSREANRRVDFVTLEPSPSVAPLCTWPIASATR